MLVEIQIPTVDSENAYRVLIRIEAAMVETSICVADRNGKRRPRSVVLVIVDKIDVVRSEIRIAEWRIWRHGITCDGEQD